MPDTKQFDDRTEVDFLNNVGTDVSTMGELKVSIEGKIYTGSASVFSFTRPDKKTIYYLLTCAHNLLEKIENGWRKATKARFYQN